MRNCGAIIFLNWRPFARTHNLSLRLCEWTHRTTWKRFAVTLSHSLKVYVTITKLKSMACELQSIPCEMTLTQICTIFVMTRNTNLKISEETLKPSSMTLVGPRNTKLMTFVEIPSRNSMNFALTQMQSLMIYEVILNRNLTCCEMTLK